MRKGLYRKTEGQKSGKDGALEPLASCFRPFFFSILGSWLDAFLLLNLQIIFVLHAHLSWESQSGEAGRSFLQLRFFS
jgi:hypothetical protein